MCSVTDFTPISVKVCVKVFLSSGHKVSPFGDDIFRGYQIRDQKMERGIGFWGPLKSHLTTNILTKVGALHVK